MAAGWFFGTEMSPQLAQLLAISEEGLARIAASGLRPEQLPRHVAIIMDGNGRWAQGRGQPRIFGHRQGIRSVRSVVEEGCRIGLDQLTLYCLSVENWKRPPRELKFLFRLLRHFLVVEVEELMEQKVRLTMIGRREGLPIDVLRELDRSVEATAENTGMTLCLAINYGGRTEIADAARRIAEALRTHARHPTSDRPDAGRGPARGPDRRRATRPLVPALVPDLDDRDGPGIDGAGGPPERDRRGPFGQHGLRRDDGAGGGQLGP